MMFLYKISQDVNEDCDTFTSAIVCADNKEEARMIHPDGLEWDGRPGRYWCASKDVMVSGVGVSFDYIKKGVILASAEDL